MAGEPESLDSDEPLPRRIRRHHYDRLLMLSDGVFAIAITLLVLDVRPPHVWDGDLTALVQTEWRALFGYLFGFAAVGGFWTAHRGLFARIRHVDGPATALSLLLLLLIGLVPAAAALVSEHGPTRAMRAYFLLVAAISAVQLALWAYAAFVGDLVDPAISRQERLLRTLIAVIPLAVFSMLFLVGSTSLPLWTLIPVLAIVAAARNIRRRLDRVAR